MKSSKHTRKNKKTPQGPVPVQLPTTSKRPASSPKESETPKRNKYSPGNSPSYSAVTSPPQNCPPKYRAPVKPPPKKPTIPVPFEFSRRSFHSKTAKSSKSPSHTKNITFGSSKTPPPFNFSLTPPSLRDIAVPSLHSDFPTLPSITPNTPSTPNTPKSSPLLPKPTPNDKAPKVKTYKPTPDTHINDSQIASTSSNTNQQASSTQQTHSPSKNINSFYTHFDIKDWDSERVIISHLEKQYPQLEVSYIGQQNTSITIKAHNKQSFIVLANISSLNNKKVKFVPKEPFTPTLSSIVSNVPLTVDPKRLLAIPQITSVERIHQWDPIQKTKNPTNNIKVGYQALQLPSHLTLDTTSYEIRRYTPAPIVCGKCCQIGHQAYTCKATSQTCHICAGPHSKKSCPNPTNKKCLNCGNAHSANYRGCPAIKAASHQISNSINPLMQIRVPRHPPTHYQSPSHFNPYFLPPRGAPAQYPHPRYPPQHFHPQFVPHRLIHDPPHRTSTPHSPTLQPTYAAMAHPRTPALSNPRPVQQTSQKV